MGLRTLFRKNSCYGSATKLEFCLKSEKALSTCDKGAIQWQTHIPQLYLTYYIVLIRRIFELEYILKVKSRLGIIHCIDRETSTYFSLYPQADTLVKVNSIGTAVFGTYRRVVILSITHTQVKGNIPLRNNIYIIPSKDRLKKLRFYIELWEQIPLSIVGCLSLSCRLHSLGFLSEIQAHTLTNNKVLVLLGSKENRGRDIVLSYLFAIHIFVQGRIILVFA